MPLQLKLFLVLLVWLTSNVAPMRFSKTHRHDGITRDTLRREVDHSKQASLSNFNNDLERSTQSESTQKHTGSLEKKPKKSTKSTSLRTHNDDELQTVDLSLACKDVKTHLSLSNRPTTGPRGVLSLDVLEACGYSLSEGLKNTTVLVKDCDVTLASGHCSTRMQYEAANGHLTSVTLPCTARSHRLYPNDRSDVFDPERPQADDSHAPQEFKCNIPNAQQQQQPSPSPQQQQQPSPSPQQQQSPPPQSWPTSNPAAPVNSAPQTSPVTTPRCPIDPRQRIQCGVRGISSSECSAKGCCFNAIDGSCFYPMNECTADKRFIFVVEGNIGDISLNLTKLKTSGAMECRPQIITGEYAVFFFGTTQCGARSHDIGDSVIFSVEVLTSLTPIAAISGNVSIDLQFRMMVECRYPKSTITELSNLVTTGVIMMSPSVFRVDSEGLFSVSLKIAEDDKYKKFYPSYHQPLRVLLGSPVYLEVSLVAPVQAATLLVHYCIAYPKSATKALVLLHDGCPNPKGDGVLLRRLPGTVRNRRMEVTAFQFMSAPDEFLDTQIYFLCSTELCMDSIGTVCEEGCFSFAP